MTGVDASPRIASIVLAVAATMRARRAAAMRRQMVGAGLAQVALLVLFLLASQMIAAACRAGELALRALDETHDLRWSIAGEGVDTLSELRWQARARGAELAGSVGIPGGLELRARGAYAAVVGGRVRDSDYAEGGRQGEFSRSVSRAGGRVRSAAIELALPLQIGAARLAPLVGVGVLEQRLRMTDGIQVIPDEGRFGGLHSRYDARWTDHWVGAELERAAGRWSLALRGEAIWSRYEANALWNLRGLRFEHEARGRGYRAAAELGYRLGERWQVTFAAELQHMRAASGLDRMPGGDGRLNGVELERRGVSLGAARAW